MVVAVKGKPLGRLFCKEDFFMFVVFASQAAWIFFLHTPHSSMGEEMIFLQEGASHLMRSFFRLCYPNF